MPTIEAVGAELAGYPAGAACAAVERAAREVRGRLTLADILGRIPGSHPSVERAWAMCAKALTDEAVTIVQTHEMARAFGYALRLHADPVAARMAFKAVYEEEVANARSAGGMPRWFVSPGTDAAGREGPVLEAVADGRLPWAYAEQFCAPERLESLASVGLAGPRLKELR